MDFLRDDLGHLFDEQGIDKSAYESKVEFRDPITRYNSVSGQNMVVLIHTWVMYAHVRSVLSSNACESC